MDFKDADLRSVLKIFSQQSGLNFIAAADGHSGGFCGLGRGH